MKSAKNVEHRNNIIFTLLKSVSSPVPNFTTPAPLKDHCVKIFCMEYHQRHSRNV